MKKRIGTKLYDTEKSAVVKVTPDWTLYKKHTTPEYFLFQDDTIIPLSDEDLKDYADAEELPKPKQTVNGIISAHFRAEDTLKLRALSKAQKKPITVLFHEMLTLYIESNNLNID